MALRECRDLGDSSVGESAAVVAGAVDASNRAKDAPQTVLIDLLS